MEKIKAIAKALDNNKEIIIEARRVLDSAMALSLLGASIDQKSRDMITIGMLTSISSTITLGALSITGMMGPVVLGVTIIPTIAKVGLFTGMMSTISGFIHGFRVGVEQSEKTLLAVQNIQNFIETHKEVIKDVDVRDLLKVNGIN